MGYGIKLYRGQDLLFLLLVLGRRDELLNLVELPEALLGGLGIRLGEISQ